MATIERVIPAYADDLDAFAWSLCTAWTSADWPTLRAERAEWISAFRRTGHLLDGRRDEGARPRAALRLYRGACAPEGDPTAGVLLGLSWTRDRAYAEEVAHGLPSRFGPRIVLEAHVPPHRLLARFTLGVTGCSRGENEVVADVQRADLLLDVERAAA